MPPVTPDQAAATLPVAPRVRDLTDAHEGMLIEVTDDGLARFTGEYAFSEANIPIGKINLAIREPGQVLITHLVVPLDATYKPLSGMPEPSIRPIDTALIRELTAVSDELKSAEGRVKDLKQRKKELSDALVEGFVANDATSVRVGGRTSYMHTSTYAQYNDRPDEEGGGKYTDADLIPVLQAIGRDDMIKPRSVHSQTLAAFLREFRKAEQPVPDAVAKIVELAGNPEIRVHA